MQWLHHPWPPTLIVIGWERWSNGVSPVKFHYSLLASIAWLCRSCLITLRPTCSNCPASASPFAACHTLFWQEMCDCVPKMHAHSVVSVLSISPEETSTGQMPDGCTGHIRNWTFWKFSVSLPDVQPSLISIPHTLGEVRALAVLKTIQIEFKIYNPGAAFAWISFVQRGNFANCSVFGAGCSVSRSGDGHICRCPNLLFLLHVVESFCFI